MTAYSNSSIKTYEQCPYKYKLTRIDKLKEPTGDAAVRGTNIHTVFEKALATPTLPVVPVNCEIIALSENTLTPEITPPGKILVPADKEVTVNVVLLIEPTNAPVLPLATN